MGMSLRRTPLYGRHRALGATMVDFAGWHMPVRYPQGIIEEHLAVRTRAGLFDVSHMGRFRIAGPGALDFLRYALTNDAGKLDAGAAHYTLIADDAGKAIDDAYLYRIGAAEFMLVVNAANRETDLVHLSKLSGRFSGTEIRDVSAQTVMLALSGPRARSILQNAAEGGAPPAANAVADMRAAGVPIRAACTGYTGEPLSYELFADSARAAELWDALLAAGAAAAGLGARDTLRLEAALPLYGREYAAAPDGTEIPILANRAARQGVDLSSHKRDFMGRAALAAQRERMNARGAGVRHILPVAVMGRSAARSGDEVFTPEGRPAGWITSGTAVPYAERGTGTHERGLRAAALALLDGRITPGVAVDVKIRTRTARAFVVPRHLRRIGEGTRAVVYRISQEGGAGDAVYCEY